MTTYDRSFWEERSSQALREHGDRLADRPPNAHLSAEAADLRPGLALDAGCGHGAETLRLAARGWQVTAVDFSATALAHARATAEDVGSDVAELLVGHQPIDPATGAATAAAGQVQVSVDAVICARCLGL